MKRKSEPIRRRLAAFLVMSMVVSQLQGVTLAFGSDSVSQVSANLIQLDTEKIREAAEQAVESGMLVSPPVMVATASTASNAIPFQNPAYELADASTLLAEGTVLPNKTSIRIFLEPDLEIEESEEVPEEDDSVELINDIGLEEELEDGYSLSGREQLIFLIKNEGKEAQGYQFQFGNKVTGVVVVESSSQLMEEYEMGDPEMSAGPGAQTEPAAPETEVQPEVPETETQPEVPESEAAPEAPESEAQPEIPESEAAPEIPESEVQPEIPESEVTPETSETEAQPEVPETEAQPETEESQEPEIQIETEAEQESGSEAEPEEDIVVEVLPEEDQNIEEGQADPENLAAGILERTAEFLTGTMTVYAAETATSSDAVVATGSNVIDTTKKEEKVFTAAADTANLTKLEIQPVNVLVEGGMEAIQVGEPKMAFFSRMFKNEEEISSVGMFALALEDVVGNNQLITVSREGDTNGLTLYNYAPDQDGNINDAYNVINRYIANQDKNSSLLRFFPGGFWTDKKEDIKWDTSGAYEMPYNSWETKDYKPYNVVQNMPATDGSNNKNVNFDVLFPDTSQTVKIGWREYTAVNVYKNVNSDKFLKENDPFFTYDSSTGSYTYDSESNGAEFDGDATLDGKVDKNGGFWPFGQGECFFGMEVGFDFYKPLTGRYNGQDMKFSFSGDDDVWVYISEVDENGEIKNKKLALDLGGIHGRVDGTINFKTGVITYSGPGLSDKENNFPLIYGQEYYNRRTNPDGTIYGTQDQQKAYAYLYTPAIADAKGQNNKNYINYVGMENTSGMYHLSFFYLERGGTLSNCKLEFNLPVIPTEQILVTKEVKSDGTTNLDDMKYGFWLVSADENSLDQLKTYMGSGEQGPDVAVSKQYIGVGMDGGEMLDVLPQGHYFYIEEENPGHDVNWEIIQNEGTVVSVETSTTPKRSDIYQVVADQHRGFHIRCENIYEGLAPEIHKRAWKKENEKSTYDIVLDVTGDTKDGKHLENPVVTDEIAVKNLAFTDKVNIGGREEDAPNLYLVRDKVDGAGSGNSWNRLNARSSMTENNEPEITYRYNGDDIAWYNLTTHTLTWNVAQSLREGQTRTLIYEVKATGPFEENAEDYPDFGSVDTGTHAEKRGYWSNVKATLTYGKDGEKILSYLQPVIRPDKPQIQTFALKKVVKGDDTARTKDFTFQLDIKDEYENQYEGYIQIDSNKDNSKDGKYLVQNGRYSLTLSHDETVTIGLPEDCTYTITEQAFDDGSYATTQTTIKKDRKEPEVGNTIEGIIVYGERHSYVFTNTVEPYSTLTVVKKVDGAGVADGTYSFEVEADDAKILLNGEELENGIFTITTENKIGSVELKIHPKDAMKNFTITETNTNGAWETKVAAGNSNPTTWVGTGDPSVSVTGNGTATFVNCFYSHSITLKKEVIGYNPDQNATYDFDLTLTGSITDEDKSQIQVSGEPAVWKDADTISVKLTAGKSITLTGLPKSVTNVTILEDIANSEDAEYEMKLDHVEKSENGQSTSSTNNPFVVELEKQPSGPTVTFFNKYEKRMGSLEIIKQIVDEDGELTQLDEKDPRAFRFKVEQLNAAGNPIMTFYKTIVLSRDSSLDGETTGEFSVPLGTYRIEELDTVKYQVVGSDTLEVTVELQEKEKVVFKNTKTTDQYFTNVSFAVNKVEGTTNSDGTVSYAYVKQPLTDVPKNIMDRLFGRNGSEEASLLPSRED